MALLTKFCSVFPFTDTMTQDSRGQTLGIRYRFPNESSFKTLELASSIGTVQDVRLCLKRQLNIVSPFDIVAYGFQGNCAQSQEAFPLNDALRVVNGLYVLLKRLPKAVALTLLRQAGTVSTSDQSKALGIDPVSSSSAFASPFSSATPDQGQTTAESCVDDTPTEPPIFVTQPAFLHSLRENPLISPTTPYSTSFSTSPSAQSATSPASAGTVTAPPSGGTPLCSTSFSSILQEHNFSDIDDDSEDEEDSVQQNCITSSSPQMETAKRRRIDPTINGSQHSQCAENLLTDSPGHVVLMQALSAVETQKSSPVMPQALLTATEQAASDPEPSMRHVNGNADNFEDQESEEEEERERALLQRAMRQYGQDNNFKLAFAATPRSGSHTSLAAQFAGARESLASRYYRNRNLTWTRRAQDSTRASTVDDASVRGTAPFASQKPSSKMFQTSKRSYDTDKSSYESFRHFNGLKNVTGGVGGRGLFQRMNGSNYALSAPRIPVRENYVCHICGEKGHHIRNCSKGNDPKKQKKVKPATGLPRSWLRKISQDEVASCDGDVYTLPDGSFAVLKELTSVASCAALSQPLEKKIQLRYGTTASASIEDHLRCPLCHRLFQQAVLTPCCGETYCQSCLLSRLAACDPQNACPSCREIIDPVDLAINQVIQDAINAVLRGGGPSLSAPNNSTGVADISPSRKNFPHLALQSESSLAPSMEVTTGPSHGVSEAEAPSMAVTGSEKTSASPTSFSTTVEDTGTGSALTFGSAQMVPSHPEKEATEKISGALGGTTPTPGFTTEKEKSILVAPQRQSFASAYSSRNRRQFNGSSPHRRQYTSRPGSSGSSLGTLHAEHCDALEDSHLDGELVGNRGYQIREASKTEARNPTYNNILALDRQESYPNLLEAGPGAGRSSTLLHTTPIALPPGTIRRVVIPGGRKIVPLGGRLVSSALSTSLPSVVPRSAYKCITEKTTLPGVDSRADESKGERNEDMSPDSESHFKDVSHREPLSNHLGSGKSDILGERFPVPAALSSTDNYRNANKQCGENPSVLAAGAQSLSFQSASWIAPCPSITALPLQMQ